jgi:hypothetical protein
MGEKKKKKKKKNGVKAHPKMVEFELLDLDQVWSMGPNTRFVV